MTKREGTELEFVMQIMAILKPMTISILLNEEHNLEYHFFLLTKIVLGAYFAFALLRMKGDI